jgi:phosphoglycerol transferase MdoB-like AlkP superfamily enzyme
MAIVEFDQWKNDAFWRIFAVNMKQRISLFGIMGLYWLSFFVIARLIFLLYNHDMTATLNSWDILTLMVLGLRMDAAMASYWLALSGLLLTASLVWNDQWVQRFHFGLVLFLLVISSLITTGDLELYRNWGFRMDTTPLMYIGSEGAGSIQPTDLFKLIGIFAVLFSSFLFFYQKTGAPRFKKLAVGKATMAPLMFLITALLFIPIRSSFSVAPLNTGVVYFHKTIAFANHAGINVVWNFFKSLTTYNTFKYPVNFLDSTTAHEALNEMTQSNGPTKKVINDGKPNIILIILESFTAKVVEPLGGQADITPQFNRLTREGILFENFYSSGDRTDKGIVSILSAYPAQPKTSIIKFPEKTQGLPFLSRSLEALGYHTSFVYGGDIGFANMESYVTNAGFSHVTEDDDFDDDLDESKWGVHDHLVFERLLQECDTASGPFFKVMLSLSSHEPFDVPLDPPFMTGKDETSLFLNSIYYTDKSLGTFMTEAQKRSWWKNTWVIITADHGHRYPNAEELKEKERFKIPMLWLGGAISKKDTVVNAFAGHTDIANSVLGQINVREDQFSFSKDIFSGSPSYAVYFFNNGYGYIDPLAEDIYDFDFDKFIKQSGTEESTKRGRAFVQCLFSDYNNRK